jgi:hypothetical protein
MIRVLTFAPQVTDGTSFYRLGGVLPYLEKEYSDIHIKDLSGKDVLDWPDYVSYDVAVFQRPFISIHLNTINMLKLMGIKVIIDYDDDVLNVPMHNPFYNNYEANKENIKKISTNADEIWVSTNGLKETFSEFNKNIKVIPNAHNDYLFPVKNKIPFNDKLQTVAYRGGSTHEIDVYSQLNDWIEIINKNKTTEFYFMGARFPYLESRCGDNYIIIPGTHILDYFRNMHKVNPNIFIYTLEDNKFNIGKSNISWIESTYAGAAVIAPEFLTEFIRPGISNFTGSLKETFDKIKKDKKMLKNMNDLSWDYIQAKLLLSHVNQQRYNSIVEVKNRK